MIPQWVSGAAARDMMGRYGRGGSGGGSGGGGCSPGILSFIAVAMVAWWALAGSRDAGHGWFLTIVLTVSAPVAVWWAAYRAKGWMGVVAAIVVAGLSAWALYYLRGDVGAWGWPLAWGVVVLLDQAGVKAG
jgi:hypothetical protein